MIGSKIKAAYKGSEGKQKHIMYTRIPHPLFRQITNLNGHDGVPNENDNTALLPAGVELSVIPDILPNYIKRLFMNGRTASVSEGQVNLSSSTPPFGCQITSMNLCYKKIALPEALCRAQANQLRETGLHYPVVDVGIIDHEIQDGTGFKISIFLQQENSICCFLDCPNSPSGSQHQA